jgi:hypothetical protein
MNRFQTLLSNSTCAATARYDVRGLAPYCLHRMRAEMSAEIAAGAARIAHANKNTGGAVQVDSIKTRVESAHGFSA